MTGFKHQLLLARIVISFRGKTQLDFLPVCWKKHDRKVLLWSAAITSWGIILDNLRGFHLISCKLSDFDFQAPSRGGNRQTSLTTAGSPQDWEVAAAVEKGKQAGDMSFSIILMLLISHQEAVVIAAWAGPSSTVLYVKYIELCCGETHKHMQTALKVCLFYCCKKFLIYQNCRPDFLAINKVAAGRGQHKTHGPSHISDGARALLCPTWLQLTPRPRSGWSASDPHATEGIPFAFIVFRNQRNYTIGQESIPYAFKSL